MCIYTEGLPMPNLTQQAVEKLIPVQEDALHFDEGSPGFFLRTYKSGAPAVFGVKYSVGGKQRRMNLGLARADTLDEMRELAEVTRAKAKLGQDTLGEQKQARAEAKAAAAPVETLGTLWPRYLKDRIEKGELRWRSHYNAKMYFERQLAPFHGRTLRSIERHEVVALIDGIVNASNSKGTNGRVTADRVRTVLSGLYRWAIERNHADTNPCSHIAKRAPSDGRDRVLSFAEMAAIWEAAADGSAFSKAVRLLMLTGARKEEIVGLQWPEIDIGERQANLPAERVKIKKPFVVCFSATAIEIIKSVSKVGGLDRLFVTFSASHHMSELRAKLPADMPHWTLHDLRRSFSTHANDLNLAPPHVIDVAMSHVVGNKVSRTYNKALYLDERHQLAADWAKTLKDIVAGRKPEKKR
jgi:integrase